MVGLSNKGGSGVTRTKILEAALKVFSRKGFNGATTSEIALEAGVAEGTIFRYFETKKDLLLQAADPVIMGSLRHILEQYRHREPEVFLKILLNNRMQVLGENMDLAKVLVYESVFHPEIKKKFITEIIAPAAALMEEYFHEQVKRGTFRELDPSIAVRSLVGMLGVFVVWRHTFEGDTYQQFSDEGVIATIVDVYLNGVLKRPEKGGGEG